MNVRSTPQSSGIAIAYLDTVFPAISHTFVLNQITGMIDRGQDVTIFARTSRNEAAVHATVEQYDLMERTHFYNTPPKRWKRVLRAVPRLIELFLANPNAARLALDWSRYNPVVRSLEACFAVTKFKRMAGNFDLVHCHFGLNGLIGAMLKESGLFKGKLVVSFYGSDLNVIPGLYGEQVYRPLFEQADRINVVCEYFKKIIEELGCPPSKVKVHHLGVDCDEFEEVEHSDKEKLRLISIGRFQAVKGFEYGLRAFARVAREHPGISYMLVGDGHLREQLERLSVELGVEERVEFTGLQPRETVRRYLKQADIMMAPSIVTERGAREGTPMVILEAMATGLPVISSCISGIPEMVTDGEAGFLVEEKNVDELSSRLLELVSSEILRSSMGRAGREKVKAEFNIQTLNDRLLRDYSELAGGKT